MLQICKILGSSMPASRADAAMATPAGKTTVSGVVAIRSSEVVTTSAHRHVRALSRRKDSLRGQPHVSCRPADPRRHLRCAGGLDHGNLTLTGEYRDVLGRPAHRARDARLVPHLLHTTASSLLGGTALRVLGRRLQSPTRPVS